MRRQYTRAAAVSILGVCSALNWGMTELKADGRQNLLSSNVL